jgi:hypothetical protein
VCDISHNSNSIPQPLTACKLPTHFDETTKTSVSSPSVTPFLPLSPNTCLTSTTPTNKPPTHSFFPPPPFFFPPSATKTSPQPSQPPHRKTPQYRTSSTSPTCLFPARTGASLPSKPPQPVSPTHPLPHASPHPAAQPLSPHCGDHPPHPDPSHPAAAAAAAATEAATPPDSATEDSHTHSHSPRSHHHHRRRCVRTSDGATTPAAGCAGTATPAWRCPPTASWWRLSRPCFWRGRGGPWGLWLFWCAGRRGLGLRLLRGGRVLVGMGAVGFALGVGAGAGAGVGG